MRYPPEVKTGIARAAALLLFAAAGAAGSVPPQPTVEVNAPPELAWAAKKIEDAAQRRLSAVTRLTGSEAALLQIILAGEDSAAARETPEWIAGYAVAPPGFAVLFPSRVGRYPDDGIEELFLHEAAHLLIAEASGYRPIPRWFHEGFAVVAGRSWRLEDRTRFAMEALGRQRQSLAVLDGWFRRGPPHATRAYAISGAFVNDLLTRQGNDTGARILRLVREGRSFEEAFMLATGMTLPMAEDDFWSRQRRWSRWLPFATSPYVLWIAVTLLALFAFLARRRRDAAIRARWAEEEEDDDGWEGKEQEETDWRSRPF
jgi:hypothetical protein